MVIPFTASILQMKALGSERGSGLPEAAHAEGVRTGVWTHLGLTSGPMLYTPGPP